MSITVIKEGNVLRILSSSQPIPENTPLELEVKTPDAWDLAQLESVFNEDDEDWGDSLDALRLPPLNFQPQK
jgi:hypothetical protein